MITSGKTPLIRALVRHHRLNTVAFHMPGHKMGQGLNRRFARLMRNIPFSLDMTELPGLDDLHNPKGVIKTAQARAAELFGADHTFFLINGTTVGIHAAVLSICRENDEILLPRNVHRSVIGACILSGVRPRYLPLRVDPEFLTVYPSKPEEVEAVLNSAASVKAVFQVYPSYFGLVGNLAGIVNAAHKQKIPVIVDEAHASHFRFSSLLPQTALEAGADLSIQSTHKTLGAFTQASMLHLSGKTVDYDQVAGQLLILQSTSPSYLLMASLDAATGHLEASGKALINRVVKIALQTRDRIKKIPGLKCLGDDTVPESGVASFDPTKLYVSVQDWGISGAEAAEILLRRYRIQVEMSDRIGFLCMFSIGSTAVDANRLVSALRGMAVRVRKRSRQTPTVAPILAGYPEPRVVLSPREAWFASKRAVPLRAAVGRLAGEIVAPYPPGIPILCPGEEITPEIIEIIELLLAEKAEFHGPQDPELNLITVVG